MIFSGKALPIVATVACEVYVMAPVGPDPGQAMHNASLIAAAPDLYEAARELLDRLDSGDAPGVAIRVLRAAVAKAEERP